MQSHYKKEQLLDAIPGVVPWLLSGVRFVASEFWGLTVRSPAGAGRGLTPGTEQLCQVLPIKLRTRLRSLNRAALAQQHRVLPGLAFRVFSKPDQPSHTPSPQKKKNKNLSPRLSSAGDLAYGTARRGQRRASTSGLGDRSPQSCVSPGPRTAFPAVVAACPAHLGGGGILLLRTRGHARRAAAPPLFRARLRPGLCAAPGM